MGSRWKALPLLFAILLILIPADTSAVRITGREPMPTIRPAPSPTPTPAPSPTPPAAPSSLDVAPEALPSLFNLRHSVVGKADFAPSLPAQDGYAALPGVFTFRGGPWRQNAAYGYATAPEGALEIVWEKNIGSLDNWSGVGWNGQPVIVQWDAQTRAVMNLYEDKKTQDGLIEVIYGTLDGNIYFLDLSDGSPTRDPIRVGFPLKSSVSLDPRGVPLLYAGQGISRLSNKSGKIGLRVFSLIDGEQLYFINGIDNDAYRRHGAWDSVCLVDAATDTLIAPAENGMLYLVHLNTAYDPQTGALSLNPVRAAYRYRNNRGQGMENSVAVYGHYAYFADNGGMLQCVDLRALTPVWAANVTDDTDATVSLDPRPDGRVRLYTGCEVDRQGNGGKAYLRCFDALSGALLWEYAERCTHDPDLNGGMVASPLVGQNSVSDLVYFHLAKTVSGGGALLALDKETGEVVWRNDFKRFGWSSPVAVYGASGEAHILLGDSGGNLRLMDARTGEVRGMAELHGNVEGSPAVFGDMLVVGTRGCKIYGVRIR